MRARARDSHQSVPQRSCPTLTQNNAIDNPNRCKSRRRWGCREEEGIGHLPGNDLMEESVNRKRHHLYQGGLTVPGIDNIQSHFLEVCGIAGDNLQPVDQSGCADKRITK
jgi:hypothetical protein